MSEKKQQPEVKGPGPKSFFSPFKFLSNIFKRPTTIRFPFEDIDVFDKVGASPTYRGLHSNDMEQCIGCGTCQEICPTDAIVMVDADNTGPGKLGKRPHIDYGRCCFCAFCVDMCTTGSLQMSRKYIRTYPSPLDKFGDAEVNDVKKNFMFLPGEEFADDPGHVATEESTWLDLERTGMGEHGAKERIDGFLEIVKGFTKKQALLEASRCVECGVCVETCPANMDIPQYIHAIWVENPAESVDWMYKTNPLPGICGRICTHKCETVCSLSHRGEAVAIRWLKRYAVDNLPLAERKKVAAEAIPTPTNKKVAIIGSGPGGLSAAYYLVLMGYDVTIFEANEKAGGTMRYGIPEYRMPYDNLDKDIEVITSLGVNIKTNSPVKTKAQFDKIQGEYDAVLLAVGFGQGRSTGVIGSDCEQCFQALDLLEKITKGEKFFLGKRIAVIGGGNVAYDIGRSLARLQKKEMGRVDVTLTCLERQEIMPADKEEIQEGEEEGIRLIPGRSPKEIIRDEKGHVTGLRTIKCVSVFDSQGRFAPEVDENDVSVISTDMVIEAIGQAPDYGFLSPEIQSRLNIVRGKILTDENGGTEVKGLFAAGDIVHGPDVIHAIADGHRAARAIDKYLGGKRSKK